MEQGRDRRKSLARLNLNRGASSAKKQKAVDISSTFVKLGKGNEESSIETARQMLLTMQNDHIPVDQTRGEQVVAFVNAKSGFPGGFTRCAIWQTNSALW